MDKQKIEKRMRFEAECLEVREAEGDGESRIITGRAIVFNSETTLWDGKYYRDREIIAPSCCTKEFLAAQDIKLNLLHERSQSLCRFNKGVGTLQLDLREDGLYFSAEMPKCDIGDRALELVRNKTYTGCSFEFTPKDYTEEVTPLPDGREDCLLTHTTFEKITALTIAMDPAYEDTTVGVREQMQKRESDRDEEIRQREEARKQAAHEREVRIREARLKQLRTTVNQY